MIKGRTRWSSLWFMRVQTNPTAWTKILGSVLLTLLLWEFLIHSADSLCADLLMIAIGLSINTCFNFVQDGFRPYFKGLLIVFTTTAVLSMLTTIYLFYDLEKHQDREEEVIDFPLQHYLTVLKVSIIEKIKDLTK